MTNEFPSVFRYCQSQRDLISSLIEVIVGDDMRELDVKNCSQMLMVETAKIIFIKHC